MLLLPFAGETGFPVSQLAAQKQMSINLVHVETWTQFNTAAGNWPQWSPPPLFVMVVPRLFFFLFFFFFSLAAVAVVLIYRTTAMSKFT